MHHRFALQVFRDGDWVNVKAGLTTTLAAWGLALELLKQPGETWRVRRDDGLVVWPGEPTHTDAELEEASKWLKAS